MGLFLGLVSAATFGLIPLFTIPLLRAGYAVQTALAYRFGLAAAAMALILALKGEKFGIGWLNVLKIMGLAGFYLMAVVFFFHAFAYLPSGVVATLQFLYPLMVMAIMIGFFHESFSIALALAALLAVAGVALLSNASVTEPVGASGIVQPGHVLLGVCLALLAGLCNGLYFVGIQVAKIRNASDYILTFYVMAFGAIFCVANALLTGTAQWISGADNILTVLALALVTAVFSNLTLIMAIKRVGSTLTSIFGVAEPLTAVAVGVLVFGEPAGLRLMLGVGLIVASVMLALLGRNQKLYAFVRDRLKAIL